jgi:photosystem II stability/assembly factor-like uncharacterized protein
VVCAAAVPARALTWFPLGPFGGDARSIAGDAHDTKHLYLGTATGWIYESHDGGASWVRLSQLEHRNDLVIKQILVDPRNPQQLMVAAYDVERPDGGIFMSSDGGRSWQPEPAMLGKSIRSLARASSDPDLLVAGTLQGVFRSVDDGKHWAQISPIGSTEIHEIESVAIDPDNPKIIYAGTWHLPWKTTDGGAHWENIKQGIIEDSDVFSIIIDPRQPNIVYASACSGIYKSTDYGRIFKGGVSLNKLQGIPSTARRTRKLVQDPQHPQTVYAGTTEGLYRTMDGGLQWDRMTSPDVIVNDVWVDPTDSNHILLATDRGGVLASNDFAMSFLPSNQGFSSRQVTAFAVDPEHPADVYVGVVNDKETGGVFLSRNGGITWSQKSEGLGGRDVFSLAMTPDDILLAGTNHGIFRLVNGFWLASGMVMAPHSPGRQRHVVPVAERNSSPALDGMVYAITQGPVEMFAATSEGLLRSNPDATQWEPVSSLPVADPRFLALDRSTLVVAGLKQMAVSMNDGVRWTPVALPAVLTQISAVAVDDQRTLWVGGREGVFYSTNNGVTWSALRDLMINDVDGISFDRSGGRVLLTCSNSGVVFSVSVVGHKVTYWDSGWKLRFARSMGDYILGATLYDGMVVQPKMVDSGLGNAKVSAVK